MSVPGHDLAFTQRSEEDVRGPTLPFTIFGSETGSLTEVGVRLSASNPGGLPSPPPTAHTAVRTETYAQTHFFFHMGSENLNSGPPACVETTLSPLPNPDSVIVLKMKVSLFYFSLYHQENSIVN